MLRIKDYAQSGHTYVKDRAEIVWQWTLKHERALSLAAFACGFIWDNLTLTSVELWLDNLILLGYLVIAGTSILFLNTFSPLLNVDRGETLAHSRLLRLQQYLLAAAPLLLQFAFGGLFSSFFIFYFRSATVAGSWPFLLVLLGMLVGNEFFKTHYLRLAFQASVFFIAVFSYAILILPVATRRIGTDIFLASGLVSLAVMSLFGMALARFAHTRLYEMKKWLGASVSGIYLAFNLMYVANIIPPIPLALKDGGIYHSVERAADGNYLVGYEDAPWYALFRDQSVTIHLIPGQPLYAFSAVFAPTRLHTTITHRWEYFDEERGAWVMQSSHSYPIAGGREKGYRGYTLITHVQPGRWRVDVTTQRGQIIGRMKITVVAAGDSPKILYAIK